jgi:hypothetical protein
LFRDDFPKFFGKRCLSLWEDPLNPNQTQGIYFFSRMEEHLDREKVGQPTYGSGYNWKYKDQFFWHRDELESFSSFEKGHLVLVK